MNGQLDDIWVRWETPRRFTVKLYGKRISAYGDHYTLGVVAESVEQAARAAQMRYPEARIQSINDTGAVDIVACALREGGEQMEFECAPRWRDVADELPREAQEVLFVRGEKTVFGAWIGGIFWHNNQKMAAAYWMPIPKAPVQRGSK